MTMQKMMFDAHVATKYILKSSKSYWTILAQVSTLVFPRNSLTSFQNANQEFFWSSIIAQIKCSYLTNCPICRSSNTPAFIFNKRKICKFRMRYLKQPPSAQKFLTNYFIRLSFICRDGNMMFLCRQMADAKYLVKKTWGQNLEANSIEPNASHDICYPLYAKNSDSWYILDAGQEESRQFSGQLRWTFRECDIARNHWLSLCPHILCAQIHSK